MLCGHLRAKLLYLTIHQSFFPCHGGGLRRLSAVIASTAPSVLLLFQPEFQSDSRIFWAECVRHPCLTRLSLGSLRLPNIGGSQGSPAYLFKRRSGGNLAMVCRLSSACC